MRFITNTQPLCDALNLGVINSNVSKFYKKSCVVQLKATDTELIINTEANQIVTEIRVKGSGDSNLSDAVFVDSLLFKQLVSTFDCNTTIIEFLDSGIVVHAGNNSSFTLPKVVDESDFELARPIDITSELKAKSSMLNKDNWKFVKDNQMYAIGMGFIHPVYTLVWAGSSGDVIVGDFDNSIFTKSKSSTLQNTCLLTDTIINLFTSLPDNCKVVNVGRSYGLFFDTEGYTYCSEIKPRYEDEGIGSYNADIILDTFSHEEDISVGPASVNKLLSQAELLSNSLEDSIKFSIHNNILYLQDNNVNGSIPVVNDVSGVDISDIEFKLKLLRSVFAKYTGDVVHISPRWMDDKVVGIVVWDDQLASLIACLE